MEKRTGKIMKVSRYSRGLVIPKDFVTKLKWKEKQKVTLILKGKNVIISDWKKH